MSLPDGATVSNRVPANPTRALPGTVTPPNVYRSASQGLFLSQGCSAPAGITEDVEKHLLTSVTSITVFETKIENF